ncbi:MAG: cystathionine beta-lyase [Planctomycetota bacterium]|jgi:cystathionine beta-lyase
MNTETKLIQFDASPGDPHSPLSTPIYQTATFEQASAVEFGEYDYSRSGNPTRKVLEELVAELEGGARALAYGSGMGAIAAVARLAGAGDQVVAGDDVYGGTYRLLCKILEPQGIVSSWADVTDPEAIRAAVNEKTRIVLIETPTNPLQRVADISAIASIVHERGALLAVDNSLLSPYLQRPLDHGADLVIHSGTKALGGHSDVTAGIVVARDEEVARRLAFTQNAEGTALGPFDSWLLLRGIKTLALRIQRQEQNARTVADYLRAHPAVKRVHFCGFEDHPGFELHFSQARGTGAVLAFETGSRARSQQFAERAKIFKIAVSFGSVHSQVCLPGEMSHACVPKKVRRVRGFPDDLVRLSMGIEDIEDLLADLERALSGAVGSKVQTSAFDAPVLMRERS